MTTRPRPCGREGSSPAGLKAERRKLRTGAELLNSLVGYNRKKPWLGQLRAGSVHTALLNAPVARGPRRAIISTDTLRCSERERGDSCAPPRRAPARPRPSTEGPDQHRMTTSDSAGLRTARIRVGLPQSHSRSPPGTSVLPREPPPWIPPIHRTLRTTIGPPPSKASPYAAAIRRGRYAQRVRLF